MLRKGHRVLYLACNGLAPLPLVEQEAAKLSSAETDCCVESVVKMNKYFKFLILLLAIQAPSVCLPLSMSNVLSISLKSGSDLQIRQQNT